MKTANIDHFCLFCGRMLNLAEPRVRNCALGGECCKACAAACGMRDGSVLQAEVTGWSC